MKRRANNRSTCAVSIVISIYVFGRCAHYGEKSPTKVRVPLYKMIVHNWSENAANNIHSRLVTSQRNEYQMLTNVLSALNSITVAAATRTWTSSLLPLEPMPYTCWMQPNELICALVPYTPANTTQSHYYKKLLPSSCEASRAKIFQNFLESKSDLQSPFWSVCHRGWLEHTPVHSLRFGRWEIYKNNDPECVRASGSQTKMEMFHFYSKKNSELFPASMLHFSAVFPLLVDVVVVGPTAQWIIIAICTTRRFQFMWFTV